MLQSQIVAYVPNSVVKYLLVQSDVEGKRGKWIAKIQEYDLDIKPNKLVKGQGLAKLLTESNFKALGINLLAPLDEVVDETSQSNTKSAIKYNFLCSDWYKDIIHYLCFFSFPPSINRTKYIAPELKAQPYVIIDAKLYWKDPAGILLLCLTEGESMEVIKEYHEILCGGHYSWKVTAHKILKLGFYWPSLFSDVYRLVRSFQQCQLFAEKKRLAPLTLLHVFVEETFKHWGLDFIEEINPPSSGQFKWILTATNYFTKWVEEIPTKKANDHQFSRRKHLQRIGCPVNIVTYNAQVFN